MPTCKEALWRCFPGWQHRWIAGRVWKLRCRRNGSRANENDGVALNQWLWPRTADLPSWGFRTPIGPNTPANYGGNPDIRVNNIYEAFEPCDPRLEYSILEPGDQINGLTYAASWSRTGYSIQKFLISEDQLTGAANSPLNIPLIRYTDVLLWNAEALNELFQIPQAEIDRNPALQGDQNPGF